MANQDEPDDVVDIAKGLIDKGAGAIQQSVKPLVPYADKVLGAGQNVVDGAKRAGKWELDNFVNDYKIASHDIPGIVSDIKNSPIGQNVQLGIAAISNAVNKNNAAMAHDKDTIVKGAHSAAEFIQTHLYDQDAVKRIQEADAARLAAKEKASRDVNKTPVNKDTKPTTVSMQDVVVNPITKNIDVTNVDEDTDIKRIDYNANGNTLANTNVLDWVISDNYRDSDKGNLHDIRTPSVQSRGYLIIQTPPFLRLYAASHDEQINALLMPLTVLLSRGRIRSTPLAYLNKNISVDDVDKFIMKMLLTETSLPFLSNTITSLPRPPSVDSKVLENMTSNTPDRKMTSRRSMALDAGPGTFTLEHQEMFLDQVYTFYDVMYNWIYYSRRNPLIKIPPEVFFPAQIIESCPIWQIMTKADGITVNRMYRYTGCIPGRASFEENTEFTGTKINKVSCEWSYNWCEFKSLYLVILFNTEVRRADLNIAVTPKMIEARKIAGLPTERHITIEGHHETTPMNYDDRYRVAIIPVVRYHHAVIEDVLCLCTEDEWKQRLSIFNNLGVLEKEFNDIARVIKSQSTGTYKFNKTNWSDYDKEQKEDAKAAAKEAETAAEKEASRPMTDAQEKAENTASIYGGSKYNNGET